MTDFITIKSRTTPANLAKLISSAPRNARGPMTEASAEVMEKELEKYPPKPPKSRYIRTYRLRAGWGFINYGATTKIANIVPYSPFVQGDNTQAKIHRGRWRTVSQIAKAKMKAMVAAAEKALSKYLRGVGL